jgi:hypothetical protein
MLTLLREKEDAISFVCFSIIYRVNLAVTLTSQGRAVLQELTVAWLFKKFTTC